MFTDIDLRCIYVPRNESTISIALGYDDGSLANVVAIARERRRQRLAIANTDTTFIAAHAPEFAFDLVAGTQTRVPGIGELPSGPLAAAGALRKARAIFETRDDEIDRDFFEAISLFHETYPQWHDIPWEVGQTKGDDRLTGTAAWPVTDRPPGEAPPLRSPIDGDAGQARFMRG